MISSVLAFTVGAAIFLCQWWGIRSTALDSFLDSQVSVWTESIAFSYALLTFFVWLPYKRDEEKQKIVEELRDSLAPKFSACGITSYVPGLHGACRLRITNETGKTTADNVSVELLGINGDFLKPPYISFPVPIEPDQRTDRGWVAIHHKGHEDYTLLTIEFNPNGNYQFSGTFRNSITGLFCIMFKAPSEYCLKIRVMAQNFPSSDFELKLVLSIKDGNGIYQLFPLADKSDRN
jgi:hypothetical protein